MEYEEDWVAEMFGTSSAVGQERVIKEEGEGYSESGATIPFTEAEVELILEKYVENYDVYHHSVQGMSKEGLLAKKRMVAELTQEVNALGVARRSERQVDQKIKDEIKILKKYGSALVKERRKTGGGRVSLPRLSEPQRRAFAALQERPRIVGLKEGVEVGQRAAKRRRLESHSPTSSPSPSYSQALSPPGSQERDSGREGSASTQGMQSARSEILRQELENQQLKKELMNKKLLLADLQIEYWTKKVQSFK